MNKGKIIAITNQKGGVGKTATTFNLGACLAEQGKKVLLVDVDNQGDLTFLFGNDEDNIDDLEYTSAELLMNEVHEKEYDIKDYIREYHNMHYIACNIEMAEVEVNIISAMSREFLLKRILNPLRDEYDYILLDCPPSLGMITINALTVADSVLIPSEAETFSSKGIGQLIKSVLRVRKLLNPYLDIDGIIFTKVKHDYRINKKIIKRIMGRYGEYVPIYDFVIPDLTEVSNAIDNQEPLINYKSENFKRGEGQVAQAYRKLAKEVLRNE